jgi:hypothetical protein
MSNKFPFKKNIAFTLTHGKIILSCIYESYNFTCKFQMFQGLSSVMHKEWPAHCAGRRKYSTKAREGR